MRLLWVSNRFISLKITARAASDGSEPSKVTCGGIFMFFQGATQLADYSVNRIDRRNVSDCLNIETGAQLLQSAPVRIRS